MVRTSPGISILFLTLVFAFAAFAQTSSGSATAQAQVGQKVQMEGQLEIRIEDAKGGGRVFYNLKRQDGRRIPMEFVKSPPRDLLTGDHVRATGHMSGGSLILYSGSTDITTTTSSTNSRTSSKSSITSTGPLPYTFGPQSTLVILVNFQDNVIQPYTVADAQNMFFGTANNFFAENSYGQMSLTGTVVGWYTIPESVTTCNTTQIAADAQNAAVAAGVKLSSFTRYVYAFPQNNVCGFAGSSYVGGNPSQSWINGNSLEIATVTHELGHALGLWHSHELECGGTSTIGSNCAINEYGDIVDVMGASQPAAPHYNAFQKERLGWLNYGASPSIQTVTTSGLYTISAYELGGSGPNALKVLKSTDPTTGAKTWYYVEARQGIGFDSFLIDGTCGNCWNETVTDGVLLHIGSDDNANSDDLLDMTPATPSYYWYFDPSLIVGQTFQDSTAGVSFTPTAVSNGSSTIQITVNGSSCSPGSPSVTVTPSQSQSVAPGSAVNFAATIMDNDSSGCSSATFNLADVIPTGWAGSWNASSLSLSPGKSGSATLTVTSAPGTAGGLYNVAVNAINVGTTSYSGSAMATYVVATSGPLAVSVSTEKSSYLPGQTVGITVTAMSGTSPAAGASVTATITNPNGKLTTLKGTTGSAGTALLGYKLSKGAPAGTYQIGATATAGTSTTSTAAATAVASASFTVQ